MSVRVLTEGELPTPVRRGRKPKYPWATVEIGDGFKVRSRSNGTVLCGFANTTYAPKKFEAFTVRGKTYIKRVA